MVDSQVGGDGVARGVSVTALPLDSHWMASAQSIGCAQKGPPVVEGCMELALMGSLRPRGAQAIPVLRQDSDQLRGRLGGGQHGFGGWLPEGSETRDDLGDLCAQCCHGTIMADGPTHTDQSSTLVPRGGAAARCVSTFPLS